MLFAFWCYTCSNNLILCALVNVTDITSNKGAKYKFSVDCNSLSMQEILPRSRMFTEQVQQTKFLLLSLSRSLQRRLTHFSRVCSPDAIRVPFSKLQAAVEEAAFSLFQIPQDPHAAAAMALAHSLVR